MMITASAPLSRDVLEFIKACFGCPIIEAYGLSESNGAVTATDIRDPISGTVGGPLRHCAIRLKDLPDMEYRVTDQPYPRGEVCVRSPCITTGYFMRPDLTAAAIDDQGYLHTGDVGEILPNGSIKIIDRSKNIFKLSQGEYIAPEKLENIFIQSNFIAQVMVHGDSLQNCCIAIVVPDKEVLAKWASENGKQIDNIFQSQDADFKKVIFDEIYALATASKLNSLEKPKGLYLTNEEFSTENDLMTPTFKLKRNVAKKAYHAQIAQIYASLAD